MLKNKASDPHLLLFKNNQHTTIKLSERLYTLKKGFLGADSVPL